MMYCRNCGKEVHEKAVACPACGVPPRLEKKFCHNCAAPTQPNQALCTKCGVSLAAPAEGISKKMIAGLLAIIVGWLGIHKFYLGYKREGIIMLVVSLAGSWISFGLAAFAAGVVGVIEGILYLTKSDEEFEATYLTGRKPWF